MRVLAVIVVATLSLGAALLVSGQLGRAPEHSSLRPAVKTYYPLTSTGLSYKLGPGDNRLLLRLRGDNSRTAAQLTTTLRSQQNQQISSAELTISLTPSSELSAKLVETDQPLSPAVVRVIQVKAGPQGATLEITSKDRLWLRLLRLSDNNRWQRLAAKSIGGEKPDSANVLEPRRTNRHTPQPTQPVQHPPRAQQPASQPETASRRVYHLRTASPVRVHLAESSGGTIRVTAQTTADKQTQPTLDYRYQVLQRDKLLHSGRVVTPLTSKATSGVTAWVATAIESLPAQQQLTSPLQHYISYPPQATELRLTSTGGASPVVIRLASWLEPKVTLDRNPALPPEKGPDSQPQKRTLRGRWYPIPPSNLDALRSNQQSTRVYTHKGAASSRPSGAVTSYQALRATGAKSQLLLEPRVGRGQAGDIVLLPKGGTKICHHTAQPPRLKVRLTDPARLGQTLTLSSQDGPLYQQRLLALAFDIQLDLAPSGCFWLTPDGLKPQDAVFIDARLTPEQQPLVKRRVYRIEDNRPLRFSVLGQQPQRVTLTVYPEAGQPTAVQLQLDAGQVRRKPLLATTAFTPAMVNLVLPAGPAGSSQLLGNRGVQLATAQRTTVVLGEDLTATDHQLSIHLLQGRRAWLRLSTGILTAQGEGEAP